MKRGGCEGRSDHPKKQRPEALFFVSLRRETCSNVERKTQVVSPHPKKGKGICCGES